MKENKTCGECQWYDYHHLLCVVGGDVSPTDYACDSFTSIKLTNGDVIWQGGDDVLMAFKKKHKCDCCIYIRNGNCTEPVDRKDRCEDGLKQWLNAPAESEGKDE